jgi:hypothetical protein
LNSKGDNINDKDVDAYIAEQIRKRKITLYDIIGGEYIDPDPEDKSSCPNERARWNKFKCLSGDLRFCELLTEGEFDPDLPYNKLAIPIKDLVRYWWNNCVDQEAFLEDILEEILLIYKDRMLPDEEKPVDISDSFDELLEAI